MTRGILQADVQNRGLIFDPRTKLIMLFTMALFVLGGMGNEKTAFLSPCLCVMPLFLLVSGKKYRQAAVYVVMYLSIYMLYALLGPITEGAVHFMLLGTAGIATRFVPSIMMGMYVVSTTTVSEFTAAMQRIHLSEKLIIPLSVMFRFFPTVADEFSSINAAMKMRGISLGGKNAGKMLEYRMIPLLSCSVKIGDELSAAALTRGLGGSVKRTNVCQIGFHIQDVAAILICVVPPACCLAASVGIL
ncbi:energy-coupling factor transporter transmembrane component T [Anaerolentibacter hominis]|uniref:energy-coupling factor transporter transmembrane component T n=1 Tax=Anaerolentibacter hominis TaxID=3079009 RepID=UPI0031B81306